MNIGHIFRGLARFKVTLESELDRNLIEAAEDFLREKSGRVSELEGQRDRLADELEELKGDHRKSIEREKCRVVELEAEEPNWVVNDIGELGVTIHGRAFFLCKGCSLEYGIEPCEESGKVMKMRPVGKREFGEVCHPIDWWRLSPQSSRMICKYPDSNYTVGEGWIDVPPKRDEG